ncbi:MAG: DUF1684 domain-containing protein [Crocinitomicaceae bacterium]|jgi:uncharacterized protein (DUF1684 family)|nr:DUF1684 domain-containing protein [Crocinitomicaceae bacterium]
MRKFLFFLSLLGSTVLFGQEYADSIQTLREEHQIELTDTSAGVLTIEDLVHFEKANYFPISQDHIVQALFTKDIGKKFKMPTTTERTPIYRRYGYLDFEIEGKKLRLTVYQNIDLMEVEGYEDYLFVPFLDETNGITTYGGGRYLDFRIPNSELVKLDFNTAYNPYCAYSHRYSCPIPPSENTLNVAIEAGEMTPSYKD